MGLIAWIVLGIIAGSLAKCLMPGKDPGGCIITMLLGIAGGIIGGWLGTQMGFGGMDRLSLRSIIMAIAGACLLLFLYRQWERRKAQRG